MTNDQIRVVAISSLSGPVPGLSASAAAATRAYVAFRNATGGVCGRAIVLQEADDGTDNGRYRSLVVSLEPKVFGIAGGFSIGDVGGIDVIKQTKIPIVTAPSASAVSALPTVYDVNPDYANLNAVIGKYRYLYDEGARKVAVVYLAADQSRAEANNQMSLMKAARLEIVQVQELPIATLSYDSAARSVANSGADYLLFIGETNGNASMARSMADTGYKLKFAEYFSFAYGTSFLQNAGTAAEGTSAWLRTLPNEEAATNEEMARFVTWMGRAAPGEAVDPFAADAWIGTKAFFDALEALPGPITRESFVAQLGATKTYDAGGMAGPIRFGAKLSNACVIGMRVESGKWTRMAPAQGFLCA
ncbi:MAG: ABC transporter substrate-binding protein [Acidimicrobiales bacterium]